MMNGFNIAMERIPHNLDDDELDIITPSSTEVPNSVVHFAFIDPDEPLTVFKWLMNSKGWQVLSEFDDEVPYGMLTLNTFHKTATFHPHVNGSRFVNSEELKEILDIGKEASVVFGQDAYPKTTVL
jgi:hypothetical protein